MSVCEAAYGITGAMIPYEGVQRDMKGVKISLPTI